MKDEIRRLLTMIPADMLEYSQELGHYSLFNDEQMHNMVNNCIEAGVEPEDVYLYVYEQAKVKLMALLIQRVADGFLSVEYDDKSDTINFKPINHEQQ